MRKTFEALCYNAFIVACFVGTSGGLIGGRREINVNENQGASNALAYVVNQHNININNSHSDNSNSFTYVRAVSEVSSAQSQVVEGLKYYFTVIMAWTNCTMVSPNELCAIPQEPENAQTYECQFTVWSRPWLNSTIVTEKCTD